MNHPRPPTGQAPLVWCLAYSWCFAARDFGLPLGASDEHTRQWSVRSEQRRGRPKELLPEGLRRKWLGASLLLSHRSLRICSFVAPRPRPFWAQRNTSYMRDTTLASLNISQPLGGTGSLPVLPGYQPGGRTGSDFSRPTTSPLCWSLIWGCSDTQWCGARTGLFSRTFIP